MKSKLVFAALLTGALAIGIMTAGCASTPAGPSYPFDGTTWTKSEEAELTFAVGEGTVRIDGIRACWGGKPESTLNPDGTLTISGSFGNGFGHYTGTWTKKSGEASGGSLNGTVWTRTEEQTMEFSNGAIIIRNGKSHTLPSKKYRATDVKLTVVLDNGPSSVNYTVDGSTLTISNASGSLKEIRRIGGTWTKQ